MAGKTATAKAASDQPANGKAGAAQFTYRTLAATVGGALLTLTIAVAQTTYSNHLEVLRRQGEQGVDFQTNLLNLTGGISSQATEITNILERRTVTEADRDAIAGAAQDQFTRDLLPLTRQWRVSRLLLRNRAAQIYGREVGALVYSRADAAFRLDDCNVVTRDDRPAPANCEQSAQAELAFLNGLADRSRTDPGLREFRTGGRSPTSFDANAEIAFVLLDRYFSCTERPANPPPRCANLPLMREIARRRVDLLGVARENIANAIVENSYLRD
jgi:hypothetical protein